MATKPFQNSRKLAEVAERFEDRCVATTRDVKPEWEGVLSSIANLRKHPTQRKAAVQLLGAIHCAHVAAHSIRRSHWWVAVALPVGSAPRVA